MSGNHPDEIDILLDEALAGYSSREPRPGLEQRVLSRVRAARAPRRFGWWRWAIAVPVFASLVLLAVALFVKPLAIDHRVKSHPAIAQRDLSSAQASATTHVVPARSRPAPLRRAHRVVSRPSAAHSPLPKLDIFPLPAPLRAEERALIDLAERFPDRARELLIEPPPRGIQPIEIPEIQIPPLTSGSER